MIARAASALREAPPYNAGVEKVNQKVGGVTQNRRSLAQ
jgi:hypothetical protein